MPGSIWLERENQSRQHLPLPCDLRPRSSERDASPAGFPARLGPADFEFGVIAGNQAINPLGWWLIPRENDAEVSVESARLEGMSDFIVVPENYTFMMNGPEVAKETVAFLRTGTHGLLP